MTQQEAADLLKEAADSLQLHTPEVGQAVQLLDPPVLTIKVPKGLYDEIRYFEVDTLEPPYGAGKLLFATAWVRATGKDQKTVALGWHAADYAVRDCGAFDNAYNLFDPGASGRPALQLSSWRRSCQRLITEVRGKLRELPNPWGNP